MYYDDGQVTIRAVQVLYNHVLNTTKQYSVTDATTHQQDENERGTSAYSQFDDAVRDAISVLSIEVKEVATGIMSLLSNDDEENGSRSQAPDENTCIVGNKNPVQGLAKQESDQNKSTTAEDVDQISNMRTTNVFCCIGNDVDDSRSDTATTIFQSRRGGDCNNEEEINLDTFQKAGDEILVDNNKQIVEVEDDRSTHLSSQKDNCVCCCIGGGDVDDTLVSRTEVTPSENSAQFGEV